jgi:hypothetical protein
MLPLTLTLSMFQQCTVLILTELSLAADAAAYFVNDTSPSRWYCCPTNCCVVVCRSVAKDLPADRWLAAEPPNGRPAIDIEDVLQQLPVESAAADAAAFAVELTAAAAALCKPETEIDPEPEPDIMDIEAAAGWAPQGRDAGVLGLLFEETVCSPALSCVVAPRPSGVPV